MPFKRTDEGQDRRRVTFDHVGWQNAIKQAREEQGPSYYLLAQLTGLNKTSVVRAFLSPGAVRDIEIVASISAALDIDYAPFLADAEERPRAEDFGRVPPPVVTP